MANRILNWCVDIECKCPNCSGKAVFDNNLFEYVPETRVDSNSPPSKHRKGGYYVIEKYPHIYPWIVKDHQYYNEDKNEGKGVLKCSSCGAINRATGSGLASCLIVDPSWSNYWGRNTDFANISIICALTPIYEDNI